VPPGLLATRVFVDLVGLGETEARKRLLIEVGPPGRRPTSAAFPGATSAPAHPAVPVSLDPARQ
jgi:hypothetical protein